MNLATVIRNHARKLDLWVFTNESMTIDLKLLGLTIPPKIGVILNRREFSELKNYFILSPHSIERIAIGGKNDFKDKRITTSRFHQLPSAVRFEIRKEVAGVRDDQFISYIEESI